MAEKRSLYTAQHEAAHVVVGAAFGLKLCKAVLKSTDLGNGWMRRGFVWFDWRGTAEALAMMAAAGIAWDKAMGHKPYPGGDFKMLKHLSIRPRGIPVYVKAAGAMLTQLGPIHSSVTRALLERDLTGVDIETLAHGGMLEKD